MYHKKNRRITDSFVSVRELLPLSELMHLAELIATACTLVVRAVMVRAVVVKLVAVWAVLMEVVVVKAVFTIRVTEGCFGEE